MQARLALLVLAAITPLLSAQKKPKATPASATAISAAMGEAKKLVDEWVQNGGSEQSAKAIARLDPAHVQKALAEVLKTETTRSRGMELVATIRHPQAWDLLSPFVTAEDHVAAIDALVACGDRVSENGLRTLWAKEPDDTERMAYLTKTLSTSTLRGESVRFFVAECLAGRHLPHSHTIATKALEIGADATAPEIQKALGKYEERMKLYARAWRTEGTPLELPVGTRYDDNVLCDYDTDFTASLPEWCQTEDHTLVLRVLPLAKKSGTFGYASKEGIWSVEMNDGVGQFVETLELRKPTSVKQGAWSEVQFLVRVDRKQVGAQRVRLVVVHVDGKEIAGPLGFDGPLLGMVVQGRCLVGGCYVVKN